MIDITGIKQVEQNKEVKPTYSPELGEWFLTDKQNSADIYQSLSVDYQEGRAGSYFGNIETTPKQSIGFFNKLIGTPVRATTRGVIGLGSGLAKAKQFGDAFFEDFFYDLAQDSGFAAREYKLDDDFKSGLISQEQYDSYKEQLDLDRKTAISYNQQLKQKELDDTKKRLEKISLWNERVIKKLGVESKEGEWKTMSALFESAPSTLAALGVFIATKNPVLAASLFGGVVVAPQAAEMAQKEIELGKDLHSSLAIGAVTGVASGSLDYFGAKGLSTLFLSGLRKTVAKNRVYAAMQKFVFQNSDNMAVRDFGTYFRMGVAGAAEEGVTEGIQGVIEANMPRLMGGGQEWQGFWNEISDYAFQAWVGALSGGLFGSVGGAVTFKALSKDIEQNLIKKGIDKNVAKVVSKEIARPLVEHTQELTNQIINDVDNTKMTDDAYAKSAQLLRGAFTPEDIERQRQLIERDYDSKFPQGTGNANKIASYIALENAKIEAEIENTELDSAVNKIKLETVSSPEGLDVSDKFYNARNKKGDIVGAASKDLSNHIVYLLNNATPDVLVHELTHIFLNTITRAINSGKISASFSQTIANVTDVIGVPEGENNTFSERQQEELSSLFQQISSTGEAPSLQLEESFNQIQRIAGSALAGAKATGEINPKIKKLFSDFFAPFKANLDIDTSVETINRLKEAIAAIKRGERPSARDVVILTKLLQFGRGYRPAWIGYSVEDYIKEHPEYNNLSVSEKRALLEKEGFEIASERQSFPDDAIAMQAIEANIDRTFRTEEKTAISRREEIAKYEEIANMYREVFNNNQLEADNIGFKINDLRREGYVIADKEFVNKLNKDLNKLKKSFIDSKKKIDSLQERIKSLQAKELAQKEATKQVKEEAREAIKQAKEESISKQLEKQALKEAKETGRSIFNAVFGTAIAMSDVGINVDTLENLSEKLNEALNTNNLSSIMETMENVMSELESASNILIEKYYKSDFYKKQEGIIPPVVDVKSANNAIVGIIARQIANTKIGKEINFIKIYADIDKMLQKNGVDSKTRYKILRDLNQQKINIATGKNVNEIVNTIVEKANHDYRRSMYERTEKLFNELLSKAKGKKLIGNDNTAIIKIADILQQMRDLAKEGGLITKKAALDTFINNLDLFDVSVGQDVQGNKITMNPEQISMASSMIAVERARLTDESGIPNETLQNAYMQADSFDKYTQERVERYQREKAELLRSRVKDAMDAVSKRVSLPSFAQKIDSLLFAGPIGGLRSNLIAVFGEEYANKMDATVELAMAQAELKRFRDVVNTYIEQQTRGVPAQVYKSHLQIDKPYSKPKNEIESLLSEYTRGQLMDLWMIWQNDKGKLWVKRTFGENTDSIMEYLDGENGIRGLDKDVAQFMMSCMKEIYPRIADTYEKITGKPLGYQNDYWPLYVMTRQASEIVMDDMMYFNANPVTKEGPSIVKERKGVSTDKTVEPEKVLKLDDPIDKFDRYFRAATKYIYVTPKVNIISEIVRGNSTESQLLRNQIKEKFGESMITALSNDLQFVLGVQRYKEQTAINKAVNEMLSNYVIGKIALVPWIGVKQTVALINYAERMPLGQFVGGLLEGLSHPVQTWKEMMKYRFVDNRFRGQMPMAFMENKSMQTEMLLGILPDKYKNKIGDRTIANISAGISKIKNWSMLNVRLGDSLSVVFGGYAYVQYLKSKIKNDPVLNSMNDVQQKAYIEKELALMTETSQQSGLDTTKGSLQRSEDIDGALLKRALMFFSTANSQYARKVREALYEYRNGNISRQQALKTIAIYAFANPVLFAMLSMPAVWAAMFRAAADEDDEKARKQIYIAFMRPIFDNIFSAYGNIGGTAEMVTDWTAKKAGQNTYGIDGDMSPFFIKDLERALQTTSKTKKDISAEEWVDSILTVAQGISPAPLQNIKKMLKGMYGVATDEEALQKWISAATVLGISEKQAKQLFEE